MWEAATIRSTSIFRYTVVVKASYLFWLVSCAECWPSPKPVVISIEAEEAVHVLPIRQSDSQIPTAHPAAIDRFISDAATTMRRGTITYQA
jgi:hypothetical protein